MNILVKPSNNNKDTLCIYTGANVKFAHYDVKKNKVSILENKQTAQFVKINGKELLNKVVLEEVERYNYNNSPFAKLSKDELKHLTNILGAIGILGASMDNGTQEIKGKYPNIELPDLANLQEYLNRFMKSSAKALGTAIAINSFDYGESLYNMALKDSERLNILKCEDENEK